jgi:hypothetical protein
MKKDNKLMLKKNINVLLSLNFLFFTSFNTSAETIEIDFVYVGEEDQSALLGVQQGLYEANQQGQFLGQNYKLDIITPAAALSHDYSQYIAVLTAVDINTFNKMSDHLPDTAVFNLMLDDDSLRRSCLANALHTIPSASMKSDAVAQWHQKKPGANVTAQAWHGDFVKFAARDLNKRFKKKQGQTMDDDAWAGWAAVKMTSDSVARENISNAKHMLTHLKTNLSFDGQKGSNMNFRETGQLRQLMILVEDGKIVAEAPVRGVARPPTLDSLGLLNCDK